MPVVLAKVGLALGAGACAAAAYGSWKKATTSAVALTLDAAHLTHLEINRTPQAVTVSDVFSLCVGHARAADPEDVFNTARCVGGKKTKVDIELEIDQATMQWLSAMREKYQIADVSKTARIIVDYNIQVVPKIE